MSLKNRKNLIAVGGVVVALLIGTVLLGGFAKNEPAVNEKSPTVGACSSTGCGGCPMAKADSTACANMSGCEEAEAGCCGKPCPPDCPKPCCGKEGCAGTRASGCCSEGGEPAAQ
jgi:hypothetical protein